MNDLISIIIPIYNIEEYLESCLDSVIANDYMPMEIILINDGSTDGSCEICKRYVCSDTRFVYLEQENGGLVRSRKKGLAHARGKYVIFVDGDDYVEPNMVSKMYEYMMEYDVDFIHANCIEHGKNNCYVYEKRIFTFEELTFDNRKKILLENVLGLQSGSGITSIVEPSIYSKIFKKEFIKKCYEKLPDQQQYGEDLLCLFYAVLYCRNMVWIPDAYYHYRTRIGSLSNETDCHISAVNVMMLSKYLISLCEDEVKDTMFLEKVKNWSIYRIFNELQRGFSNQISKKYHLRFDDFGIRRDCRVVLYGAGEFGQGIYQSLIHNNDVKLVAWVDKNAGKFTDPPGRIVFPCVLEGIEYDKILLAVQSVRYVREIKNELRGIGVQESKIIWVWPKAEMGFWIDW